MREAAPHRRQAPFATLPGVVGLLLGAVVAGLFVLGAARAWRLSGVWPAVPAVWVAALLPVAGRRCGWALAGPGAGPVPPDPRRRDDGSGAGPRAAAGRASRRTGCATVAAPPGRVGSRAP
ncbi:hypothetical protein EAO71_26630 [Streptomyces sp. ms191]|uniref:hypothetical protein n=1 Tax=unclassified Streptomyces TaxID=2593676 RepID=UPI0011CD75F8|nr:hypothetical protein [Streptomyces sp. ms191]TXS21806.1 hypothetical protein EAO71_26630 [Streptomyces sp. ms191]